MAGGFDIATFSTALLLAGFQPAGFQPGFQCDHEVPAPKISIRPTTQEIKYDFTLTTADLGRMKNDTISPYAPTVDTSTGGLREERPQLKINVKLGTREHRLLKKTCMWYTEVDVEIALAPKIYLAQELNYSPCREAVINHEHKHVNVDRMMMNKYAHQLGEAVKEAVTEIGTFGPFDSADTGEYEQKFFKHVEAYIAPVIQELNLELRARQQHVDSLEEYEYVSQFCKGKPEKKTSYSRKKR